MSDIVPRLVLDDNRHYVLEWICPGCHAVLKRLNLHTVLDASTDVRCTALDQPEHHTHTAEDMQPVPIPLQQAAAALLSYAISDDGRRPAPPEHHAFNQARTLADMGLLPRLPYPVARHYQIVDPANYDVHAEHCCSRHGCKYFYKYGTNCPVTLGLVQARYTCEQCDDLDDDTTDLYEPEEKTP